MSDYAAWRISYQTSEQAAKAAYEQTQEQKARIAQLEAQLIAEAARAAEQKLRADQLEQQHAMQAKMHAQAVEQLAAAQQGAQDAEPAAWVATFKPEGLLALHSVVGANLEELKQSVSSNSVFRPLYTHPTQQGLDAKDAARYRWLRRKVCIVGGKFHILNLDPRYIAPDAAIELDSAIDAAMRKEGRCDE